MWLASDCNSGVLFISRNSAFLCVKFRISFLDFHFESFQHLRCRGTLQTEQFILYTAAALEYRRHIKRLLQVKLSNKFQLLLLLPTALAQPSVCPSVHLFPLYLRYRLTVDLELLQVRSWPWLAGFGLRIGSGTSFKLNDLALLQQCTSWPQIAGCWRSRSQVKVSFYLQLAQQAMHWHRWCDKWTRPMSTTTVSINSLHCCC